MYYVLQLFFIIWIVLNLNPFKASPARLNTGIIVDLGIFLMSRRFYNYVLVIVIETFAVIVAPRLSVTWTAKLNVPAAVGVPEITPALRVNPPGSEPVDIDQV